MPTRAQVVSEWESAPLVLGWLGDGALAHHVGPVDVSGLEAALERTAAATHGELASIPDIVLTPHGGRDSECGRWLDAWHPGSERRDLLIRDNRRRRWLALREAWVTSRRQDGASVICLEHAEPTDGPSL